MRYIFGVLFFIIVLGSCVRVGKRVIEDGQMKISTTEKESLWIGTGQAQDYVDDVMQNAKGWEKPYISPSDDASELFLWIAGACFIIGVVCFCVAYFTHQHSLIVVGFIWLGACAFAIGIAEIAQHLWILPVAVAVLAAILGWRWRNKHIKNIFRKKDE